MDGYGVNQAPDPLVGDKAILDSCLELLQGCDQHHVYTRKAAFLPVTGRVRQVNQGQLGPAMNLRTVG